ncbi:MAG: S49 family peptidase [Candidatus Aenigmarchaeota archaeon]|nr:S49 family peptidase [Candidatus Aenigmarchaeota archaeon]
MSFLAKQISRFIKRKNKRELVIPLIALILTGYAIYSFFYAKIVILHIEGPIFNQELFPVLNALDDLEKRNDVKAVVLRINSPGGGATEIHEIYLKILKLRSTKPIVTSIDSTAASGAYYLSVGTDYIFAKQSSDIGAIGVVAEIPEEVEDVNIITSGPFKRAVDEEEIFRSLELLKQDFIKIVEFHRGDKLRISGDELLTARLFVGYDAIEKGLIDEIGGLDDAIDKAKEMAGLFYYKTVHVYPTTTGFPLYVSYEDFSSNTTSVPAFSLIYIKGGEE